MPTASAKTKATASARSFNAVQFIRTRRQQLREHTDEELTWWIQAYTAGEIPDYQMSSWLMAVCLNGLSKRETSTLTRLMTESGVRLEWRQPQQQQQSGDAPAVPPLVDKHSSGGIGDKVSILLAPLVATFGVAVPMMAGRGLGHTGGTIDKLESIPGFRTDLTVDEFQRIVLMSSDSGGSAVGCCITAAGPSLCPADQKMYALRDVTDTVTSLALQTASIMCKKIAENPDSLVLDVKYGVGSFQSNVEQATKLAVSMVETGEANGLHPTTAFLTRMDHPLGRGVGNWLEIVECIEIMKGVKTNESKNSKDGEGVEPPFRLSQDLITLVTHQAAQMLLQSGLFPASSFSDLVRQASERLASGAVLDQFVTMVQAQGGDASVVRHPETYPLVAKRRGELRARITGQGTTTTISSTNAAAVAVISNINALTVGQVAVELGAGRHVAGEPVDPCAGIWFHAQVGDCVKQNMLLAEVYTNRGSDVLKACLERLHQCVEYRNHDDPSSSSAAAVVIPPIISHRVTKDGVEPLDLVV